MAAWKWVLGLGTAAVIGYFALPGAGAKDLGYSTIGVLSIVAVLVAVHIRRPAGRRYWYLLVAGNFCFVLGDGVYDVYQFVLHRAVPFPSIADALYLLGYPFVFAGVRRLTRARAGFERETYADAAIVSIGALALSWHFLMGSEASGTGMSTFAKLVTIAYPMMDIVLLFVVLQALLFGTARLPVHKVLATSLLSMLIADFIYDMLVQHNSYSTGNPVDAGWLIAYVLLAVAAWHPSMERIASPSVAASSTFNRRRLPVVALAGFVSPAIVLISKLRGTSVDVGVLAGLSVALFSLVVVRMWWLFGRLDGQARVLKETLESRGALEADLRHQAFHDTLTGLANRALLQERVDHALAAAPRLGGVVALCFCDLDGFKAINDSLGHAVGDEVLRAIATRLSSIVRPGDTVARLGGDEFAVLMENVANPDIGAAIARRIVSALSEPVEIEERHLLVSGSVGLAVATAATTTARLLTDADSAMYEAKAAGKNRYQLFEPAMHDRNVEHLALMNALGEALHRSELFLTYQPQFSLRDEELMGFEALLRWRHPTLGVIGPERFLALAEESGHIVPVGRWVLEAAGEQALAWASELHAPSAMAVNISSRQLQNPHFTDDVQTALALSGLSPGNLVLEISTNELLLKSDRMLKTALNLRALGVRLALDNFGTGYSSLSHLRNFPVDIVKIDRSFVEVLEVGTGESSAFVRAIVDLAKSLGLITVAVGVQTEHQRALLAELGCDLAQGYLFAPPLDTNEASNLVARKSGSLVAAALKLGEQRLS
jgi:diguanylate cyclase (GGDEF)-like protein